MDKILSLYMRNKIPLLVFVGGIFIIGIVFGTLALESMNFSVRQELFEYFNNFLQGYESIEYEKGYLLSESAKLNMISIIAIWIFGASVVIMPLVPVLIFFKGFVLGFTIGFLVSQFHFKGIIMAISTIFPQNILIVPAYIFGGLTAIDFSFRIIKHYRGYLRLDFGDFIDYSSKMIVLGFLMLGGSLLEAFFVPYLLRIVVYFMG